MTNIEIPDSFEELQELFQRTVEVPIDIGRYMDHRMPLLVLMLGVSILRYKKLVNLFAPREVIDSEIILIQSRIAAIHTRKDEYLSFARTICNDGPHSDEYLLEKVGVLAWKFAEESEKLMDKEDEENGKENF